MRSYDFAPLHRASVGFDQIAEIMDRVLANDPGQKNYPPYNIEKTSDDGWRISIAVAGFSEAELNVELRANALIVTAKKQPSDTAPTFLHRGIANRAFERRFHLADHIRVTDASHIDGMLHIDLLREVPEALRPRQISIGNGLSAQKVVEA
ncbi:MAG: Hsp20 family protein [Rhodobacteraceae bacterium]|nr:Hsp20 family protein [Paracoccaceae bacterium]